MKPILTIFTPTYNRAYTLHLCYESLKRQTSKDFTWLIVDDGSTDNTRQLVEGWIAENIVPIRYYHQENQGMHGAHNTAYELIDTELNVCIDSDDYMPDDAVEKIKLNWEKFGDEKYAGMIGLDATPEGNVIGTVMPNGVKESSLFNLYAKHKVKGDKKLVYRTDLTKNTPPYPIFTGEKYCPLSYKYILIDQKFPLLLMNEVLCYVEYLPDGSSMNIINQYKRNPRSFSFFRKVAMQNAPNLKNRYREAIHYVSSNLLLKNFRYILESPCKLTTLFATPIGIILFFYIKNTKKLTVLNSIK
ncbi:glycosyltransferase family 2 protein [Bacillus sp. ISL-18]|uniref:glycosyltransferase family 2 protein n=1 Tax=Bacillus sp. ISL-18 TaxID=2819118 RepID=UPI001BEB4DE7|nr:glycosyltransferase family 2 protein [Bacillus sp. ISL-18]MBT2657082.1 glycosyltransferase family 2 protein [Bacillus sp. ISL-18]